MGNALREGATFGSRYMIRKLRSAAFRFRRFVVSARFGAPPEQVYGDAFYDGPGFAGTDETASAIVGYLQERYGPASVLDLGCGTGNYLRYFAARGCEVLGIEGSPAGLARVPDSVLALQFDLRAPLRINRKFDLVMSIEVAEHIPGRHARNLVASICRHAGGMVLFTAAPPGTPGDDHVNCRDRAYWDELFAERGFAFDAEQSRRLMEFGQAAGAARWFCEWAFIYVQTDQPLRANAAPGVPDSARRPR